VKYAGMAMEARTAARREDLIESGIELIGTRGIKRTKVTDVCRQAELTERYFYESFPNLEAFTFAVVQAVAVKAGVRMFTAALSETDVRKQGHRIIAECLAIVEEDPRVGRIMLVETLRAGGALSELRTTTLVAAGNLLRLAMDPESGDRIPELVTSLIASAMSGDLPPGELIASADPLDLALGGAVSEILVAWVEGRILMSQEELREFLEAMFDTAFEAASEGGALADVVGSALRGRR
jgi:AcrR family transcriptional regulator